MNSPSARAHRHAPGRTSCTPSCSIPTTWKRCRTAPRRRCTRTERNCQPMICLVSAMSPMDRRAVRVRSHLPALPGWHHRRIDDMITVRGENVYPSNRRRLAALRRTRHRVPGRRAGPGMDELLVRIEIGAAGAVDGLCERVGAALRSKIGVRPKIELCAPQTLSRPTNRAACATNAACTPRE